MKTLGTKITGLTQFSQDASVSGKYHFPRKYPVGADPHSAMTFAWPGRGKNAVENCFGGSPWVTGVIWTMLLISEFRVLALPFLGPLSPETPLLPPFIVSVV